MDLNFHWTTAGFPKGSLRPPGLTRRCSRPGQLATERLTVRQRKKQGARRAAGIGRVGRQPEMMDQGSGFDLREASDGEQRTADLDH